MQNNRLLFDSIFSNELGIKTISSNNFGKTISIVGSTHGDEIVGMEVINYLINVYKIEEKIKKGTINFIIGNKKAYLAGKKLIDSDLNRTWGFEEDKINNYEYKRAQEILPYLKKSDYVLDLHSTTNPASPMLIPNANFDKELLKLMKTKYIIHGLSKFLHGKPLIEFDNGVIGSRVKSLVLEAGQNNHEETIDNAIQNTLILLDYLGFIDYEEEYCANNSISLEVNKCFYANSMNIEFIYSDNPSSFQTVYKGQTIYLDDNNPIIADEDFVMLMPTKPRYIGEEIGYMCSTL